MQPPRYINPFSGRNDVREWACLYLRDDKKAKYPDRLGMAAGTGIRDGENLRKHLQTIYRWKTQSFLRFPKIKSFPDDLSDEEIEIALRAALGAKAGHPEHIQIALRSLDDLPGVSIPVASAILTCLYPKIFTVIDRQAYRALSVPFNSPTAGEYLHYLRFCRSQAERLGVCLRNYDRALWQYGRELGKKSRARPSAHSAPPKAVTGVTAAIKRLVWQHPDWGTEDIIAELRQEGFTPSLSSVQTVSADFRHTLRVLRSMGALKRD